MAAAKAAAEEEAAEAAAQSAAQIIAEKLPSVHEGEQAGTDASTDAAKPAAATPAVPKPPPTLHPDRYTPGTTPPASSLKPGAEHDATSYAVPSTPAPHAGRGPSQAQPETNDEIRPIAPARPPQKQNQPRPESSSPDN
jgi:rod shape-determining protein MreC